MPVRYQWPTATVRQILWCASTATTVFVASVFWGEIAEGGTGTPLSSSSVQGKLFRACSVALQDFLEQNYGSIADYTIKMSDAEQNQVRCAFSPNRKPYEKSVRGGSFAVGIEVRYAVSVTDWRIVSKTFSK